ncbi:MarR family winged helix-turn-helix transcriptional regulator [Streptomyces sp. NPDC002120]|uniref:MarR family winged helix-turn-helix transcriptional regulator n=1 Tax=Streptomyces sp. NPDC002120 TaxID=3364631 RepID=UPI0036BD9870
MSSRNVTGLVDTLKRDGLAQRVQDQPDRRSVRATITPTGLDWLDDFRQPTQPAMGAVFQNFTEDELRDLCLRMVENRQRVEQYLNATRRDEPSAS